MKKSYNIFERGLAMTERMTNKKFATENRHFQNACAKVGLPQTGHVKLGLGRQAGKWRCKVGLAYNNGRFGTEG